MLILRILTALVLIPLVVSGVIFLPAVYFALMMGIIVLAAAWEWTFLIGLNKLLLRIVFLVALIVPMVLITFWTQCLELIALAFEFPEVKEISGWIEWVVVLPVLFWVVIMILIRQVPEEILKIEIKTGYKTLIGWFSLLMAWMFISRLHLLYGYEMVLYFMILIWVADIAAYFSGKTWGKRKLSPEISPGKTIEGMYGALASAVVCGVALALIYGFPLMNATDFVLLSILTVLISIYGDLFFSLVKRQKGVKDSGNLLPGHGGILDRIDSIIAAAPFFYAGIALISLGVFA